MQCNTFSHWIMYSKETTLASWSRRTEQPTSWGADLGAEGPPGSLKERAIALRYKRVPRLKYVHKTLYVYTFAYTYIQTCDTCLGDQGTDVLTHVFPLWRAQHKFWSMECDQIIERSRSSWMCVDLLYSVTLGSSRTTQLDLPIPSS